MEHIRNVEVKRVISQWHGPMLPYTNNNKIFLRTFDGEELYKTIADDNYELMNKLLHEQIITDLDMDIQCNYSNLNQCVIGFCENDYGRKYIVLCVK